MLVVILILFFILARKKKIKEETVLEQYITTEEDLELLALEPNILKWNNILASLANIQSEKILRDKKASHSQMESVQKYFPERELAEIVSYGFKTLEASLKAWEKSELHSKILNSTKWTETGVSVLKDGSKLIITQIFLK